MGRSLQHLSTAVGAPGVLSQLSFGLLTHKVGVRMVPLSRHSGVGHAPDEKAWLWEAQAQVSGLLRSQFSSMPPSPRHLPLSVCYFSQVWCQMHFLT